MYKTKNVLCRYLVAKSQKEKKKDKVIMNQLMKAIAADASNLLQWFGPHCFKSLSMSTVIPAAAQAAAKVIVEVTCFKNKKLLEKRRSKKHSPSVKNILWWWVSNMNQGIDCIISPTDND